MSIQKLKYLAPVLLLLGACDVVDKFTVDPAEVQNAIDEVVNSGGKAELLLPGISSKVEITDENSPIYGAYIDVPSDALGKKDFDVLAIVRPVKGAVASGPGQVTVGTPVDIKMYRLSRDETYTPKVPVGVGVPVSATVNNIEIVVGHLKDAAAGVLEVLVDSVLSVEGVVPRVVAGTTGSFSPFVALLQDGVELDAAPAEELPPCTRSDVYANDEVGGKSVFTYNDDKLLIKEERDKGDIDFNTDPPSVVTAPDGTVDSITQIEYDEFGNEVSRTFDTDADGKADSFQRRLNFYDAAGNLTQITHLNNSGSVLTVQVKEYDADGNETKTTSFDNKGDANFSETLEYDAEGVLLRRVQDKYAFNPSGPDDGVGDDDIDGLPDGFVVYEYNDKGLQVKRTYQDKDGNPTQIDTFEYDDKGNKIKEIENVDPTLSGGFASTRLFTFECWE